MSKMGISTVASYTGAQIFEAVGLQHVARRRVLHRHRVAHRGHRPRRDRDRSRGAAPHRVPRPARGARAPRAAGRRRVPVAPRGRVPPVQPRHRLQAPALDPQRPVRRLQGVHAPRRQPGQAARDAARPLRAEDRRAPAGADRGGRAGCRDREALLDRRDELRLDQQGGAREPRDRDEPPGRAVQHGRGRRGPRPVRPAGERRLQAERDQAGRVGPVRRHERVPRELHRPADQDGAGREAGRGRRATRPQGVPVDREDPALHAGRRLDLTASAPRHLLDRRPETAHPRPEERQRRTRACT